MSITLPPLRERQGDVPLLCRFFIDKYRERLDKEIKEITPLAMSLLLKHSWPGNVRELENVIERAVVLAEDNILLPENFPPGIGIETNEVNGMFEGFSIKAAQRIIEKKLIIKALKETGNNRTQASRLLEISHPSLLSKIKSYNINLRF